MPSSTSSSNDRLPAGPWARIWLVAAALTLLALAGLEGMWRWHGFTPGVRDDAAFWAVKRREVRSNDPLQVVLLGASRIHVDIALTVLHDELPGPPPIQLGISASSPLPVLFDLADQTSFTGIAICSAGAFDVWDPAQWATPEKYLDFYRHMTVADVVDRHLDTFLQFNLVMLRQGLSPKNTYRDLLHWQWPEPLHAVVRPDRQGITEFVDVTDLAARQAERGEEISRVPVVKLKPRDELLRDFERIEVAVRAIQSRGGRVIFVRLPASGAALEFEDKVFPRRDYWDIWAAHTSAMMIHFQDYPELSHYKCPDFSHLDYRDAVPFTRYLARIIRAKLEAEGRFPAQPRG